MLSYGMRHAGRNAARTTAALAALGLGLGLAAPAAHAQDAATQAPVGPWVKQCGAAAEGQPQTCIVQRDLITESGQIIASVAIREVEGEAGKLFVINAPLGLALRAGMGVAIDGANAQTAEYAICLSNGCFADLEVDEAFVNRLKAGNTLTVAAINQQGQQVNFEFSLIGFTAAYNGPPATPEQLLTLSQQRDAEARAVQQTLIDAQRQAVGGAAPATP